MAKKSQVVEEKILDVAAKMEGTITFRDPVNLRINGEFNGKLETRGNLTIGENAKVKANIDGDSIIVAGKVTGDIHASKKLSIIAPAEIKGNVFTPLISITEGAILEGSLSMLSASQNNFDLKETMSLRDVAHYLEVDVQVVEEWSRKKKIPASQENGEWVFKRTEIDKWVTEEKVTA